MHPPSCMCVVSSQRTLHIHVGYEKFVWWKGLANKVYYGRCANGELIYSRNYNIP